MTANAASNFAHIFLKFHALAAAWSPYKGDGSHPVCRVLNLRLLNPAPPLNDVGQTRDDLVQCCYLNTKLSVYLNIKAFV